MQTIKTALISVYHKEGIDEIVNKLQEFGIKIISTGGTKKHIENLGIEVQAAEDLTSYPSILGGRVKTLHPKIFGGILSRRENNDDKNALNKYEIPEIDLVIVDLYPFEQTVTSGASEQEIIEKIDIGGISLIRAAAKNFKDVLVVSTKNQYPKLLEILLENNGKTNLEQRKQFATESFNISSHYDTAIYNYFTDEPIANLKISNINANELRYGENPHQKGRFFGNLDEIFTQIHGKKISYNNLLDIDAAVNLIADFNETTIAIMKHNNACGLACRKNLTQAWKDALASDPISAFGGIIIANKTIDKETAQEMNKIFFEVIIAPKYDDESLKILKQKKNRIILIQKSSISNNIQYRSLLNGALLQEKDNKTETPADLKVVTEKEPTKKEIEDLLFANILVKHSKSNTIVLAKDKQLIASGVGETSRVDALKHAIEKSKTFKFDLQGAVMSSDAFFPFADSVELAHKEGITSVIQPGGSIRDKESIKYCNENNISMVFTRTRHFKH